MKIEMTSNVKSREIETKQGAKKLLRDQEGYISLGGRYPEKVSLPVPDGQQPWSEGLYTLDASSFQVGRFGRLELGYDVSLTPVKGG